MCKIIAFTLYEGDLRVSIVQPKSVSVKEQRTLAQTFPAPNPLLLTVIMM